MEIGSWGSSPNAGSDCKSKSCRSLAFTFAPSSETARTVHWKPEPATAELEASRGGVVIRDASAARQLREVFESDWARASTKPSRKEEVADKETKTGGTQLAEAV